MNFCNSSFEKIGIYFLSKYVFYFIQFPLSYFLYTIMRLENWGLREAEGCRLRVFDMKCLRPTMGVTRWDRVRNDEIRMRARIEETLAKKWVE